MKRSGKNEQFNSKRYYVFIILIISLILIYAYKLFSMQIVENYIYEDRASRVSNRSVIISSQRGEIYDRNADVPIATNRSSFNLEITPALVGNEENRSAIIQNLTQVLDYPVTFLEQIVPRSYRSHEKKVILSGLEYNIISRLAERIELYPGISWSQQPLRIYPYGSLFSHVLGYIGNITQEELQVLFNQGYNQSSLIGKTGVEGAYDKVLRGVDGLAIRQVDALGRDAGLQDTILQKTPTIGNTLILTIDRNTQELASKALGNRIGSAIVLKPASGEILAMVNHPSYDPNVFYGPLGGDGFNEVNNDPSSPFLNRAIQAAAPPASTFKLLMALTALEENLIDPNDTVFCEGHLDIGDRRFNCWDPSGHGHVDLYDAIAMSCNVYFYHLGYEILKENLIIDYARKIGFGQNSGIDIPGEVRGLVPTQDWKERTYDAPWVGGDTVNLSIGQGYLTVTPLQLANMVSAIINDGKVYRPHVVREIRDPVSFKVVQNIEPELIKDLNFQQETIRILKESMRKVITDGTANVVVTTDAVEVAAKTGTAQTGYEGNKHSWFVSYAPYEVGVSTDETIVVVVWIDAKNEWDWWAPKAANIILHGYFNEMNYEEVVEDLKPLWYL
ncbi:penicillin-binding protein 2 [Spirochaeta lutea]|uniref:Beta-lactamase n=1 Tax=Spirochaeta lutea TaxID=1480694 RepID=A0A098R1C4_9SPIO|nr:penicillin-binding protein 2 [Spirochaeta lutea]KGE73920.1 hypothetical protein DC28_01695 [Spirochaeta lutea]